MNKVLISLTMAGLIAFSACKEDDPKPAPGNPQNPNPPELITSVVLIFTDTATGTVIDTLYFRDAALSGKPGIYDSMITLAPNTVYEVRIKIWDESKTPLEDITEEIEEEADEHQFFFTGPATTNGSIGFTYKDFDGNGRPLGLENHANTGPTIVPSAFTVTLKHDLDKSLTANGVYVASAGGETDVERTFYIQ